MLHEVGVRRVREHGPDGCAREANLGGRGCYDGDWFRDLAYSSSWLMKPRFGCAFIRFDWT